MKAVIMKIRNSSRENHEVSMRQKPVQTVQLRTRLGKIGLMLVFAVILIMCQGWYGEAQAITLVTGGAVNGSANNGGNVTLTFPVGVQQNDVVILYGGNSYTGAAVAAEPVTAGYTQIALSSSAGLSFGAWYKVMGATPDTQVIGRGTANGADSATYGIYILRGVDGAIFDTARTTATGGAATPDPPSITTVTNGAWVLALAADNANDATIGAVPAGYTNGATSIGNDTNDFTIAGATLEKATFGVENPGTWGTWAAGTVWYAITVAIRPLPPDVTAPTIGTVTPSNTVVGNYVDGTFDLSATLTDNESTVTSCQYCASSDGTCDTEWTAGTLSGSSPTWTCTMTGITGFANNTALTLNIRGVSSGGTGTGTPITKTVDSAGPASGASFSATPADASCTLNWASTTDAGSGMHASEPYEVRWQLGSDPGSCIGGAQLYIGTGTSAPHSSLTNGNTYYYRLCYKDALANQSQYSGNPITCAPSAASTPTRLYFPATTASEVNPPFTTWTYTGEAVRGKLIQSKGSSAITIGTQVGPWTAGNTALDRQYVSDPLAAQTISGTVKAYLMVMEYAGTDNATSRLKMYVVSNDGQTVRGTLLSLNQYGPATEYNNAHRNKAFADGDTVASVTAQLGDRLVVELGHSDAGGTTPEASIKWGENAADCAENETGLTDCAGWIEFSSTLTFLPPGATLMHNSTSTGSTKWGGWGVAGKRYGEITCETCHVKTSAGIKRIKDTVITSPNTPTNRFPGEIGGTAPVFSRVSGIAGQAGVMGDDSLTPRASSNRICEVCHTYDATGTNGVKLHPYSVGVAINNPGHQNNAKDCMGCHKHNQGFKAPGCDTCHGNPPTAATFGGPTGLSDPDRTGSTTAGAHNTHAVTLAFSCEACHFGYAMPENPGANPQTIDVGFSMWTKNGTGTTYGAANEVRVTDAYRGTNGTTIVNDNTRNCSNLYCHGSTLTAGSDPIPAWTDASVACGTCHGAAPATPPTAGSHQRHAGSGVYTGKQGISAACSDCHGPHAAEDGHVDGSVSWLLNTGSVKFGASARYNALAAGSTGAVAPSAAYQTCTNLYCHSSVQSNPGTGAPAAYDSPTWGAASVTCDSCHGQGTGANNGSPSTGSHEVHVTTYAYACSVCHSGLGDEVVSHADGTINLAFDAATAGGSAAYSRTNSITPQSGTFGTCSTTFCHGDSSNTSADAGTWGTNLTSADACTVCHGTKTTAADGGAAVINRAPGGNGTGVDTAGQPGTPFTSNVSSDAQVGAHDVHLRALNQYSNPIVCTECHALPAVSAAGIKGHLDGTAASMTWGTLADPDGPGVGLDPGYTAPGGSCTNIYCHGRSLADGSPATKATPDWNTSMLVGAGGTDCGKCHGNPPNTGDHGGVTANQCNTCHNHVNNGATAAPFFSNLALHINGNLESQGDCTSCHASGGSGTTGPNSRRAVMTEFGANWSHRRTGGPVTKFDCGVCHMEGSPTAGTAVTPYHNNGVIDLRDPDTGTTITNFSGAAYTFVRFSTTFASKATAAATNNTDYIVAQRFCLKCHDALGAVNSSVWVTGGSATQPFGAAAGTRLDVDTQFATTNASAHPIKAPRQNSYCNSNNGTMVAPYGVSKTPGTPSNGVVLVCWDCHNVPTTPYTNRTIDAHGSGATASLLRGVYSSTLAQSTFCNVCHNNYTSFANSAASYPHGGRGNMNNATISGYCQHCHSGTPTEARPERAKSVHGFNTRASAYPSGQRPFAFLRNTVVFVDWKPKQSQPAAANTAFGCSLSSSGSSNGQSCTNNAMNTFYNGTFSTSPTTVYGVGGVYPAY